MNDVSDWQPQSVLWHPTPSPGKMTYGLVSTTYKTFLNGIILYSHCWNVVISFQSNLSSFCVKKHLIDFTQGPYWTSCGRTLFITLQHNASEIYVLFAYETSPLTLPKQTSLKKPFLFTFNVFKSFIKQKNDNL